MRGSFAAGLVLLAAVSAGHAAEDGATAIAREVDERFAKACSAGDVPAALELYADDATAILPGEPAIGRGRAAIGEMLARACDAAAGVSFRLDAVTARRLDADHVLAVAEWTISVPGPDGKPSAGPARSSEVLVRTPNGWRYLLDHASPAPPAPAPKM